MVRSMTGFGRYELNADDKKVTVELKSVNHRYLDINVKMPKKLGQFESAIRAELKNYIERGKVDVYITWEDNSASEELVEYNHDIAAEYLKYMRKMAEEFGIDDDVRVSTLSRCPDVLTMKEADQDEEEVWNILKQAVDKASEIFVETRTVEGENLRKDLGDKLDSMLKNVDFITERSPEIIAEFKKSLEEKVKDLLGDASVNESRLLMEVTLYADKICVDEELVRLRSHIEATKTTLDKGGAVGRKLDFIAQEMNREANTILSKTNDLAVSDRAIELKTDIEKVREQIQNLE
ncbi:MAG: YicC family protein [Lachnospiraceae bacterium]|nr:YicC family protein [Lachnospiraceae bacterium]